MAWPTSDDPRTETVTLRLTIAEAAELDWLIRQTGARSRSAAVREAVVQMSERERAIKRKTKKGRSW